MFNTRIGLSCRRAPDRRLVHSLYRHSEIGIATGLERRLEQHGWTLEWADIIRDLDHLWNAGVDAYRGSLTAIRPLHPTAGRCRDGLQLHQHPALRLVIVAGVLGATLTSAFWRISVWRQPVLAVRRLYC
jgi:hypothetical protein